MLSHWKLYFIMLIYIHLTVRKHGSEVSDQYLFVLRSYLVNKIIIVNLVNLQKKKKNTYLAIEFCFSILII